MFAAIDGRCVKRPVHDIIEFEQPISFALFEAQAPAPRRGKDGRGSATSGDDDPSAASLPRCVSFDTGCHGCSALTSARKTRKKLRRGSYSAVPRYVSWLKFRPLLAMSKANLNPLSSTDPKGAARLCNPSMSRVQIVCTTLDGMTCAWGKRMERRNFFPSLAPTTNGRSIFHGSCTRSLISTFDYADRGVRI